MIVVFNTAIKQVKSLFFSFRGWFDKNFELIPVILVMITTVSYGVYYYGYLLPLCQLVKLGVKESDLIAHPEWVNGNKWFWAFHRLGEHAFTAKGITILVLFAKSHNFRWIANMSLICLSLLWIGGLLYTFDVLDPYFYNYWYMWVLYVPYYILTLYSLSNR